MRDSFGDFFYVDGILRQSVKARDSFFVRRQDEDSTEILFALLVCLRLEISVKISVTTRKSRSVVL